ncbi:MAG: hypothetical protein WCP91_01890 [Candidatus Berkelbacteria bacterium]
MAKSWQKPSKNSYKIPDYIKRENETRFPKSLVESLRQDDKEASCFVISYRYYKDKLCEVRDLLKNCHLQVLQDLRTIGKLSNFKDFYQNGIGSDPIDNTNTYAELYDGLPEFTKLKENGIQGTARLFYFTQERIFHIVAITNAHKETKKIKRH